MSTVRVTDETDAETVRDVLEARCRRLMAERAALPGWGEGRKARAERLAGIDAGLDEYNQA